MGEGGGGTTQSTLLCSEAAFATLAIPDERSWRCVPAGDRVLQPADDLRGALRMLAVQSPTTQDALDGLGHIQPGAAQGCVERHHPVSEEPLHDRPTQVTGQIVPDEN